MSQQIGGYPAVHGVRLPVRAADHAGGSGRGHRGRPHRGRRRTAGGRHGGRAGRERGAGSQDTGARPRRRGPRPGPGPGPRGPAEGRRRDPGAEPGTAGDGRRRAAVRDGVGGRAAGRRPGRPARRMAGPARARATSSTRCGPSPAAAPGRSCSAPRWPASSSGGSPAAPWTRRGPTPVRLRRAPTGRGTPHRRTPPGYPAAHTTPGYAAPGYTEPGYTEPAVPYGTPPLRSDTPTPPQGYPAPTPYPAASPLPPAPAGPVGDLDPLDRPAPGSVGEYARRRARDAPYRPGDGGLR